MANSSYWLLLRSPVTIVEAFIVTGTGQRDQEAKLLGSQSQEEEEMKVL